jgi:replicative DNA helicase
MNLKNVQAEQKILKIFLTYPKVYLYSQKVKIKYFSSNEYKLIYKLIISYYMKYSKIITYQIFINKLEKIGNIKINTYKLIFKKILQQNVKLSEFQYYVNKIIEAYKGRKLLVAVYKSNQEISEGNVDNAINELQSKLILLKQEGNNDIVREGGYLEGVRQRGQELLNKEFYFGKYIGVPTGLSEFDKIYGGIYPGEFGVVIGSPGRGKSILLLNFVIHAAMLNLPVVIVTVEMSKMQMEYRLDSRLTQIRGEKFRKKTLLKKEILQWLRRMKEFKKRGRIYIIDFPDGVSANAINLKLRQAEEYLKTKRYLLVVDYLNLMLPNNKVDGGKNSWQVVGAISDDLKKLARKKHIPIWTAAQFSKKGSKQKTAAAEDVGYGAGIAQDADFELGLIQTPEMKEEGLLHIICMKGREGHFPIIECYPDFSRMKFNGGKNEEEEEEV